MHIIRLNSLEEHELLNLKLVGLNNNVLIPPSDISDHEAVCLIKYACRDTADDMIAQMNDYLYDIIDSGVAKPVVGFIGISSFPNRLYKEGYIKEVIKHFGKQFNCFAYDPYYDLNENDKHIPIIDNEMVVASLFMKPSILEVTNRCDVSFIITPHDTFIGMAMPINMNCHDICDVKPTYH